MGRLIGRIFLTIIVRWSDRKAYAALSHHDGDAEQPMVRDGQKNLGRFVIETMDGHEQEIRVIGEGSRVMFDSPIIMSWTLRIALHLEGGIES